MILLLVTDSVKCIQCFDGEITWNIEEIVRRALRWHVGDVTVGGGWAGFAALSFVFYYRRVSHVYFIL